MDETTYMETFGNELDEDNMNNILLLTSLRSVYVPSDDGYIECTTAKDILNAIYNISPQEIQIITAYVSKFQSDYELTFSMGKVVCPHCGNVTENLDVNMDDLVFQTYQRLKNIEIDLSKLQSI